MGTTEHDQGGAPGGSVAETLKKGARVTGAQRDKLASDLAKKYADGVSIRDLAEETGRSYGFVHRMLTESGTPMRSRGGATRSKGEPKKRTAKKSGKKG
jgi:transposase